MGEHAVTIDFYGFGEKFWAQGSRSLAPLYALEDQLSAVLEARNLGELDGHDMEINGKDGTIYLYGPDADALFAVIEPVLKSSPVTQGGNATLRYGGPDEPNVMEKYVEITPFPN